MKTLIRARWTRATASFDAPDSFTKAFPGAYIPGVQGMPGVSFDEDDEDEDDEELRDEEDEG